MKQRRPLERKSLFVQRKPLAKVREKARRNEGRIDHGRIKPKFTEPNAEQQRYWNSLLPYCVNCGGAPVVSHHILADIPEKEHRRDHWYIVMLCADCHNMKTSSVHLLGSEAEFKRIHGTDLVWISVRNVAGWRASNV